MAQLFQIAFRNLLQHRKRTLLLGGAIAGVSALLVFLICLSAGVRKTMILSATTLSTGHLNVAGFYKVTAGQNAPLVTGYKKLEEIVHRTVPELDYVSIRGRGWARMVSEGASMQVAVGGIDIEKERRFRNVIEVLEGKLEDLAKPHTVLIFEGQAKKLNVKVGDNLILSVITPRGVNNTVDVRIAAIANDVGILSMWNVFVPEDTVRELNQLNADSTGALHLYLKNMRDIPQVRENLRKAFLAEGYALMDPETKPFWEKMEAINREDWTGQKLDLTTWEDETSFLKWTSTAVEGLTFILTIVLLAIIAIGIMNSMWIAIRERTRKIGTLRAIGMQRRRVLLMFLIEAFTLGSLGTFLGTILGLILSGIVAIAHVPVPDAAQMFLMASTVQLSFDPVRVAMGMAIITGCTTLISIIPSTHAARLKPITAMQHIG